ncbi:MAG TPA: carbon monoxide dehydrogenase subunit G [Ferrovibrio sp.]|jgi:carbon monoxide dehydrogenase subunit G|uniref:SRPBCC family protein n=1 Tax=Ferrovibrio sp. TaxID=1917215 RepID=UPI002B4AE338|nr:carbon monoxide dehydrogenase subunit G [Ferrovibrio sp.]HLT78078.1 carbon monoxide dehydrogenase subunit G [Ferrovibrio sp.]
MDLNGEQLIPAPRAKVWAALNDPEILRQCIAGCESVTKLSDTDFEALVQVKVGPVKAKFKGKVTLTDLDPPNSCTIVGEAQGGVAAGFGKGNARVELTDADQGATRLTYAAKAQIGGKLAQIGARLVDGVAAKMAEDFFTKFNQIVAEPDAGAAPQEAVEEPVAATAAVGALPDTTATAAQAAPPPAPTPVTGGIPSWAWIIGLIVIVGAVTLLVLRS